MTKLNGILTAVLGIPEQRITDQLKPEDVESWDSMNALILVSELERSFSIKFTFAEVMSVKCVGDIKGALRNHGVKLEENENSAAQGS